VKASNSYARTLIFGSFLLLSFVKFFSLPLFHFFDLAFYCLFSFLFGFLSPFVFPLFFALVLYLFLAHVISSLAYPTCLGIKGLVVVVVVVYKADYFGHYALHACNTMKQLITSLHVTMCFMPITLTN
jgi:hypothetical protein